MTKPSPTPQPLRALVIAEIRRGERASRVGASVLLQMNLRGRGSRRQ